MTSQIAEMPQQDPLWYKDAIIYQVHVKGFYDSNDDGIGDFPGLIEKLDYIQELGVNTIWLMPFYPSPLRDDGYDISDYHNIHPDYGSRRDFRRFVREAHRRGLRVITELVINHTSDQHPWFQAARKAPPGSAKRDFYVWSDSDQKFAETRIIFSDTESSNWAWDPVAQQYYWHRFFSHQPDLNHNNPHVVQAVIRVMRFWLDMGVDGVRLDAIPYLCVREGTENAGLPETHAVIKQMRSVVDEHYRHRIFLAEANHWPEDVRDYFGDGDECHMAFHFPLMPRMYMAIAQEERHPILEILEQTPELPESCQWAIFLRNHDELTLEMVTDRERDYLYQIYANDPQMRVNAGIRRRLTPLMDNDGDKLRLINGLLLSMPGTPIVYYGDEIGMGDNIFLGDRNSVRTPMQWSADRNGGFSRADPQRLYLPAVMDSVYGYEAVNVDAQSRSPNSLLNWMKRLIAVRKSSQAFGRGSLSFLHPGNRKILAYLREYDDDCILCVANLSRSPQPVELDLSSHKGKVPLEMTCHTPFLPIGETPYQLTLNGYGFYWFRLQSEVTAPAWHEEPLPRRGLTVLVLFEGWSSFCPEKITPSRRDLSYQLRRRLEEDVLPHFLPRQRWYTDGEISHVVLDAVQEWRHEQGSWLMVLMMVHPREGEPERYFMPLAIDWGSMDEERIRARLPSALSRIRQQKHVGILYDAMEDENFCRAMATALQREQYSPFEEGQLVISPTSVARDIDVDLEAAVTVRACETQGRNTTMVLNEKLYLKAYRRLAEGIPPELEMGRFLSGSSAPVVPLASSLVYQNAYYEAPIALMALQKYVQNQGNAWSYCIDYLKRFYEDCLGGTQEETSHSLFLLQMRTLGQRVGDLHQALSRQETDPAFQPEAMGADEFIRGQNALGEQLQRILQQLAPGGEDLSETLGARIRLLRERKDELKSLMEDRRLAEIEADKQRIHGNLCLDRLLMKEHDFVIIGLDGDLALPLEERRAKASPLKDVADLLNSLHQASQVALELCSLDRPHDRSLLLGHAAAWLRETETTLLESYEQAVLGSRFHPLEHAREWLWLYCVEDALTQLERDLPSPSPRAETALQRLLDLLESKTAARPTER